MQGMPHEPLPPSSYPVKSDKRHILIFVPGAAGHLGTLGIDDLDISLFQRHSMLGISRNPPGRPLAGRG